MIDAVLTAGTQAGAIALLISLIGMFGGAQLRLGWLLAALVAFGVYIAAVFFGDVLFQRPELAPLRELMAHSKWNWAGKIVSFTATLIMSMLVALVAKDGLRRMGFTLAQNPGSVIPALAMAVAVIGAGVAAEIAGADGADLSFDRLFYQAVAPGLDEEPMFRGLLLFLIAQGLGGDERRFWQIGWSGLLTSVLFGLGHGVGFENGVFGFSAPAIAITGAVGFCLLWIRERTGSLVLPVLVHNAFNVALSFF